MKHYKLREVLRLIMLLSVVALGGSAALKEFPNRAALDPPQFKLEDDTSFIEARSMTSYTTIEDEELEHIIEHYRLRLSPAALLRLNPGLSVKKATGGGGTVKPKTELKLFIQAEK
jgi:hypothetical protein